MSSCYEGCELDEEKTHRRAFNVDGCGINQVWQLWERYWAETSKVNVTRMAILEEYSQEYDAITNDQADNLIRRWLQTDIEQAKLRQRFGEICRKVLPGKKTATLLQLSSASA